MHSFYTKKWYTLIGKCISLLTHKEELTNYIRIEDTDTFKYPFFFSHAVYDDETMLKLKSNDVKTFYMYRDPRDVFVSLIYHIKARPKRFPSLSTLSFDQLFMDILTNGVKEGNWLNNNYSEHCNTFLPWLNIAEICKIKFEDLVGELGSGSNKSQKETIIKIANFLNITYTEEIIQEVIDNLFGNSPEFREGKIGSWKKEFNQFHKNFFKEKAGELLISFGYERDMNW